MNYIQNQNKKLSIKFFSIEKVVSACFATMVTIAWECNSTSTTTSTTTITYKLNPPKNSPSNDPNKRSTGKVLNENDTTNGSSTTLKTINLDITINKSKVESGEALNVTT